MGTLICFLALVFFAEAKQIFHLADLRVEPFYDSTNPDGSHVCRIQGCKTEFPPASCGMFKVGPRAWDGMGRPGCDPPIGLLDSMLGSMRQVTMAPQFIFVSGDINAHALGVGTTHTVQDQVLSRIKSSFPNTPILAAVGNHDVIPKNTLSQSELARLYNLYAQHTAIPNDAETVSTFKTGGYYRWDDATTQIRVLMLNSGLVSPSCFAAGTPEWQPVADAQFMWTSKQLESAKTMGYKVIIGAHISPGHYTGEGDCWFQKEAERFRTLVELYSDVVILQLYGHHSQEMFRSFSPKFGSLVAQGMSPRFSQVSSYQVIDIKDNVAANASAYGIDLAMATSGRATWKLLYSLPDTYQVPDASPASLWIAANKVVNVTDFGGRYLELQLPLEPDVLTYQTNFTSQTLCEVGFMNINQAGICMQRISSFQDCSRTTCPTCPTCQAPTPLPPSPECPHPPPSPACETCPPTPVCVCPTPQPAVSMPPTAAMAPSECPTCPTLPPTESCPKCPAPTPETKPTCPPTPEPKPCPSPMPTPECAKCPEPTPQLPCPSPEPTPECPPPDCPGCELCPVCEKCEKCTGQPTPRSLAPSRNAPTADTAREQAANTPSGDSGPSVPLVVALAAAGLVAVGGIASAVYWKAQYMTLQKQVDYMPVRATMYNPMALNE